MNILVRDRVQPRVAVHQGGGRRDHEAAPLAKGDRSGVADGLDRKRRDARQGISIRVDLEPNRTDHLDAELRFERFAHRLERVDGVRDEDLVISRSVAHFDVVESKRLEGLRRLVSIHDDVGEAPQVRRVAWSCPQLGDTLRRGFVIAGVELGEHFELDRSRGPRGVDQVLAEQDLGGHAFAGGQRRFEQLENVGALRLLGGHGPRQGGEQNADREQSSALHRRSLS